jgi:butyryl-CoA dehydrogenase
MSAYALNEQQHMLAASARTYLGRRKASVHPDTPADEQVNGAQHWAEMAGLGWLALPVPEACGGLGGSMADICALAEELGAGLVQEPYIASAVLAGMLLAETARDYAESMVLYNNQRIQRLTDALKECL